MRMKLKQGRFPWVLAAVPVAAGLLLAGLSLDLPVRNGSSKANGPGPELRVENLDTSGSVATRERLRLLDPTPLFLPSPLSSSQLEYPRSEGGMEGAVLGDYDPRWVAAGWYSQSERATGAGDRPVPGPMDAIGPGEVRRPFLGLGRRSLESRKLSPRWAVASVYSVKSRSVVDEIRLPSPGGAGFADALWSPMELLVVAEADGLVGEVEFLAGSGVAEVDDYVMDVVGRGFALGRGLRPGTYRIVIGQ